MDPPACAGVLADLLSQFFLKSIRSLREVVVDPFVQIDEVDLMVDHPEQKYLGQYSIDKISDLVHP